MSWSHQTFRLVLAVKLLGIMFTNRCWPNTFYTITAEDAEIGRCDQPLIDVGIQLWCFRNPLKYGG